ncbi:MAG: glucose 1-dehydrogenase [Ruthenibacterium sp.]
MNFDFFGKTVLITGAGAGIGQAAAELFSAAGACVVINSLSGSGASVAQKLQEKGAQALFVKADVSSPQDAQRLVEAAVQAFGGVDVLVNNAGVVAGGSVENTSLAVWHKTMRVNVDSVFLVSRAAMPYLRKSCGVIVNIASLVAVKGIADRAVYSASKGAVLALSRAMAADALQDNVRVNCLCPGTILTPSLLRRIAEAPDPVQAEKDFVARQPLGRLGRPEEVAAAILFAASSEAAFLDGTNLCIDGAASL